MTSTFRSASAWGTSGGASVAGSASWIVSDSTLGRSTASVAGPRATFSPLSFIGKTKSPSGTVKIVCSDRGDVLVVVVSDNIFDWENENLFAPFHAWLEIISHKDAWLGGRFKPLLVFPLGLGTNPIFNIATAWKGLARKGSSKTFLPRLYSIPFG